ncbi:MAG: prepilin-type N-terminal cleavage/methylation domain-containing protein [Burkholderiales bacterium]
MKVRGFTLVEVLVAMVIMAIMAVMAWQGVDGIVRTRNASQQRLETTLRLNTVIAQWDQDLASLQPAGGVKKQIECTGSTVRLTRRTPDGMQVVVWTLRPAADSTFTWERWAGPAVTTSGALNDSWLRSQQLQGNEPGSLRTLTGLSGRQVYFYRGNTWSNCQSENDEVPDGVRMVLSFAPGSGVNGDLTRDTLIKR